MRVSTCCCGGSLERGCKIIAILGLIVGGLGFLRAVGEYGAADIIQSILTIIAGGLLLWGTLKKQDRPVLAYLILEALALISGVVVAVLAIVAGVTALSMPWGRAEVVVMGITITTTGSNAGIVLFIFASIYAIGVGVWIYLWIVVYSFYRQLKEEEQCYRRSLSI